MNDDRLREIMSAYLSGTTLVLPNSQPEDFVETLTIEEARDLFKQVIKDRIFTDVEIYIGLYGDNYKMYQVKLRALEYEPCPTLTLVELVPKGDNTGFVTGEFYNYDKTHIGKAKTGLEVLELAAKPTQASGYTVAQPRQDNKDDIVSILDEIISKKDLLGLDTILARVNGIEY